MLQNAYLLAKIGADTAENEQHFAEILPTDALWRRLNQQVAESGRASGRAELRALTLGGAVWDAFRENANCGDPVG